MFFKPHNFLHHEDDVTCFDIYESENPIEIKLVALHGAGKSDKSRCKAICSAFAEHRISSIAPDLSGAGNSKHKRQLTLNHRFDTSKAIIDSFIKNREKFFILAFSMSGQTAIDLSNEYGNKLLGIVLFSPAIYSVESLDKEFGSEFSVAIRKENSWKNSAAPEKLSTFNGKIILITPNNDPVIPSGVFEIIENSAKKENFQRIIINDAPHTLGAWLNENEAYANTLAMKIIEFLGIEI